MIICNVRSYREHTTNVLLLERGWGTSKHNCLLSYLLRWRRHFSATVDHLKVTKIYIEENYTDYDHSICAYSKLSTRSRCRLDYTYWAKSTSSTWSIRMEIYIYTGCTRRKGPNFGRVFLRSNYTDITQNTYIQSSMVTEILAREKWGGLWCLRTLVCPWRHIVICTWPSTR